MIKARHGECVERDGNYILPEECEQQTGMKCVSCGDEGRHPVHGGGWHRLRESSSQKQGDEFEHSEVSVKKVSHSRNATAVGVERDFRRQLHGQFIHGEQREVNSSEFHFVNCCPKHWKQGQLGEVSTGAEVRWTQRLEWRRTSASLWGPLRLNSPIHLSWVSSSIS